MCTIFLHSCCKITWWCKKKKIGLNTNTQKGTSTPKGGELAQSVKRPSVEPKIPGSTPTQADD